MSDVVGMTLWRALRHIHDQKQAIMGKQFDGPQITKHKTLVYAHVFMLGSEGEGSSFKDGCRIFGQLQQPAEAKFK